MLFYISVFILFLHQTISLCMNTQQCFYVLLKRHRRDGNQDDARTPPWSLFLLLCDDEKQGLVAAVEFYKGLPVD